MFRATAFATLFAPTVVFAQAIRQDVNDLAQAMLIDEMVEVMRLEGLAYGDQIAQDMFGGTPPADWQGRVSAIYDTQTITAAIMDGFAEALMGEDLGPILAFYNSDPGQTIAGLEYAAREARLDPDVEQASIESAALASMEQTPRIEQIEGLIAANDLIETNVVAAMNFNYAFYLGLVEGGAFGGNISEEQILADVWGQEEAIRTQTGEWFYSFYYMALQPLEDADVETYVAFAQSDAGRTLDQALVAGFEPVFIEISRNLGRTVGDLLTVQDL